MPRHRRDGVVDALRGVRHFLRRTDRILARRVDPVDHSRVGQEGVEHTGRVHGRLSGAAEVEGRCGSRVEVGEVADRGEPDLSCRFGGYRDPISGQVHRRLPGRQGHALARLVRRRVDHGDSIALQVDEQHVGAVLDDVDGVPGRRDDSVQAVDLGVRAADRLLEVTGDPDCGVAEVHPLRTVAARHDRHRRHERDDGRATRRGCDE